MRFLKLVNFRMSFGCQKSNQKDFLKLTDLHKGFEPIEPNTSAQKDF
mgnify:FL=1